MELNELIKKVRQIEIKTKKLSNDLFGGSYKSTFKGSGISFAEVRNYSYGDDIRSIDWNVTSRSQEPYIKEFEEERELTFMILLDISNSMIIGSNSSLKKYFSIELAATLAFSSLKNNDKVGMILFSDRIEKFIPAQKGKSHILGLIRNMLEISPKGSKTDVGEALRFLNNYVKKRTNIFVISDFLDTTDFEKELALTNNKHNLYGIKIWQEHEKNIPNIGMINFLDPETNIYQWIDTDNKNIKKTLLDNFISQNNSIKNNFIKSGANYCEVSCNENFIPSINKMFKK